MLLPQFGFAAIEEIDPRLCCGDDGGGEDAGATTATRADLMPDSTLLSLVLTLARKALTTVVISMGASGVVSTAVLMLLLTASMILVAALALLGLTLGVSTLGSEGWDQPWRGQPPPPTWVDSMGSRA
jgi:hypothetical protein